MTENTTNDIAQDSNPYTNEAPTEDVTMTKVTTNLVKNKRFKNPNTLPTLIGLVIGIILCAMFSLIIFPALSANYDRIKTTYNVSTSGTITGVYNSGRRFLQAVVQYKVDGVTYEREWAMPDKTIVSGDSNVNSQFKVVVWYNPNDPAKDYMEITKLPILNQ